MSDKAPASAPSKLVMTSSGVSIPPASPRYRRRRQGTAHFHLSTKAVKLSIADVYAMDDKAVQQFFIKARWGGSHLITCPNCRTIGQHSWRAEAKRWKCAGCGSSFSLTSGTVFSGRKIGFKDLLAAALMFVNSSAGQPALELKRHLRRTYNTCFVLQHKLREALMRGYNVGLLSGEIEVDGSSQAGRRSAERRGKPQVSGKRKVGTVTERDVSSELRDEEQALAAKGRKRKKSKGKPDAPPEGVLDPEFGRRLPKDRRTILAVRERSTIKGYGAKKTRIAVALAEAEPETTPVLEDFVAIPEAILNSDSAPAYSAHAPKADDDASDENAKRFLAHRTVEHSRTLVGPAGENNNLAEELNFRLDRAEQGVYLNIKPKYLTDYAVETAFRADTRKMSNLEQLELLLNIAFSVGESKYWTGFTRGRHRDYELLHRKKVPAAASGPAKGRVAPRPR